MGVRSSRILSAELTHSFTSKLSSENLEKSIPMRKKIEIIIIIKQNFANSSTGRHLAFSQGYRCWMVSSLLQSSFPQNGGCRVVNIRERKHRSQMSVDVRLPKKRKKLSALAGTEPRHLVSPGDVITEDTGYMRLNGNDFVTL